MGEQPIVVGYTHLSTGLSIEALSLTPHNEQLLKCLINSQDDFNLFMDCFWRSSDMQFFSIMEFRHNQMCLEPVEYAEFQEMFSISPAIALEMLFKEPINSSVIKYLQAKIKDDCDYLNKLYIYHQQDPNERLWSILLSR